MTRWLAVVVLLAGCGARSGLEPPDLRVAETDAARRDGGRSLDAGRDAGLDAPALDAPTFDARHDAGAPRDAPLPSDARRDAPVPDAGDPCVVAPGPLGSPTCTTVLFAEEPTLSCPGGFVDVVARGDGSLVSGCDGVGRVEARFGDRIYRGSRSGDLVGLCIQTEFDYADGCRWRSSQRLEGDLSTGVLSLTYREEAIAGTSCFPPCTADSVVRVR